MTLALSAQLNRYLDQHDGAPMVWGVSDCALFDADWLRVAIGFDPAASWRGSYYSALGAARLVRKAGGYSAFSRKALGCRGSVEGVPQPGDIGLLPATPHALFDGLVAGICLGEGFWVSRAADGLLIGQTEFHEYWSLECLRR